MTAVARGPKIRRGDCAESGPDDNVRRLAIVLAAGFTAGVLLSTQLWVSHSSYPLVPVVSSLPRIPSPLDDLLLLGLLALLCLVALRRQPLGSIVVLLGLVAVLALFDQSRWQPWAYQYSVMLGLVALAYARPPGLRSIAIRGGRIVLVGIYFWSGIHKLNATFVSEAFPWLLEPFESVVPSFIPVSEFGLLAATAEISVAVGLLVRRFRRPAVCGAVALHVLVLVVLVAHGYNSVVWPWNVAMILLVVTLFWDTGTYAPDTDAKERSALTSDRIIVASLVALFWLLPSFALIGRFDSYLAFELYSGRTLRGVIYLNQPVRESLSPSLAKYVVARSDGYYQIDIQRWSLGELNVPPPPQRRLFRHVAGRLCPLREYQSMIVLTVLERPGITDESRERSTYECSGSIAGGLERSPLEATPFEGG